LSKNIENPFWTGLSTSPKISTGEKKRYTIIGWLLPYPICYIIISAFKDPLIGIAAIAQKPGAL